MSRTPLILLALLLITGCASLKRTGNSETWSGNVPQTMLKGDIKARNISNNDFFIQKAEIEINSGGQKQKLLGSLRYSYPGTYLLSLRSNTGIEAARIFISDDTILINDKIHRKLYYGSAAYLETKYGISFSALPLITGDYLDLQERMADKIVCNKETNEFTGNIESKEVTYVVDCRKGKLKSSDLSKESGLEGVLFLFDKYMIVGANIFPEIIEVEDYRKETVIKIQIERISFEKGGKVEFIPGKNYEKVELR